MNPKLLNVTYKVWLPSLITGSNDTTPDIIKTFFDQKNILGELHHHKWDSFGHNRTQVLKIAQSKTDYLLHMDADESECVFNLF